jgi:hypothetical protein
MAEGHQGTTPGHETDTAQLLSQLESARIALRRRFEDVVTLAIAPPAALPA